MLSLLATTGTSSAAPVVPLAYPTRWFAGSTEAAFVATGALPAVGTPSWSGATRQLPAALTQCGIGNFTGYEFTHTGTKVALIINGAAAFISFYARVCADGKVVGNTIYKVPAGAPYALTVEFATSATRTIRFDVSLGFVGIDHDGTISQTPTKRKVAIVGDSYIQNQWIEAEYPGFHPALDSQPCLLSHWLDCNMYGNGVSATGYDSFYARRAGVIGWAPEAVLIFGSVNDSIFGKTAEHVYDTASLLYAAIYAALPTTGLLVVGPQSGSAALVEAVIAAATDAGVLTVVDQIADEWMTPANPNWVYIGGMPSASGHPNPDGARRYAELMLPMFTQALIT